MPTTATTAPAMRHICSRHAILLLLALLAGLAVGPAVAPALAQDPQPGGNPDAATPWQTGMRDIQIPMRDGKALAANVLLPKAPGRYPCILVQTPYNKNLMGREFGGRRSEAGRGSSAAFAQFDRDHYVWVFVDWRGFFGSRDANRGLNRRRWKRGHDGYDCVEWIAKQPWCDGKVGTWGGSALGKVQFDTACEQPPHLVCAVPLIAAQGTGYSTYYEGGVLIESIVKAHDMLGFGAGKLVYQNRLPSRLWDFVERNGYHPEQIAVPCLMISGWWDNYPREVVKQFDDILAKGGGKARESKLIMGPWSHTAIDITAQGDLEFPAAELYSTRITKQFFDYYLRGKTDSGWKEQPRVHAYQCGEGWLTGESWKALCGEPATMFLHADGAIRDTAPQPAPDAGGEDNGEPDQPLLREFTFNPGDPSPTLGGQNLPPLTHGPKDNASIEPRTDVLVYRTGVLDKPLCIRGEIQLVVPFSCNRVDADLHVRVCDTVGDGRNATSYLVGETTIRAKLRGLATGERTVQPLTPGEVVILTLKLPPHAYTWAKGHRLTLILTGCNAPRYEPNGHTGDDAFDPKTAKDVTAQIHHQPRRCAQLVLPVVEPLKKDKKDGTGSGESERTR